MSIFSQMWERVSGARRDENRKKNPQSRKARLEALEERQLLTVAPGPMPETALVSEALTVTNDDALVTTEALDDASPGDDVYFVADEANDAPVTVDALDEATTEDDVYSVANETATNVPYLNYVNGKFVSDNVATATVVTSNMTVWNEGWYVVTNNVSISSSVRCSGEVHLILTNNCTLTVTGQGGKAGIEVTGSNSLTIYAQSTENNVGVLNATGSHSDERSGAGIGGSNGQDGCNITINGGKVTAVGGGYSAGIGGGKEGSGHHITINGGVVEARNTGRHGAGIGGGLNRDGYNITINGGTVTASSKRHAAGIGGGQSGSGYDILITGGTVTATGGENGAGIGGGRDGEGKNITIRNATVIATGGTYGAGIGGGNKHGAEKITIESGNVTATGGAKGSGIGGGENGVGSEITIKDGTVTAIGKDGGAGIGGGFKAKGEQITITGGSVTATGGNKAAGIGGGDSDDKEQSGQGCYIKITGGTVTAYGKEGGAGIGGGYEGNGEHITISNTASVYAYGGTKGSGDNGDGGAGIGGDVTPLEPILSLKRVMFMQKAAPTPQVLAAARDLTAIVLRSKAERSKLAADIEAPALAAAGLEI